MSCATHEVHHKLQNKALLVFGDFFDPTSETRYCAMFACLRVKLMPWSSPPDGSPCSARYVPVEPLEVRARIFAIIYARQSVLHRMSDCALDSTKWPRKMESKKRRDPCAAYGRASSDSGFVIAPLDRVRGAKSDPLWSVTFGGAGRTAILSCCFARRTLPAAAIASPRERFRNGRRRHRRGQGSVRSA
jgi:hypothetical protein